MNCRMNPQRPFSQPRWLGGTNMATFRSLSDIGHPESIFILIDERFDSINDGYFGVDVSNTGDPYGVGSAKPFVIIDWPAPYHGRGSTVSFSDGHVETHTWSHSFAKTKYGFARPVYFTQAVEILTAKASRLLNLGIFDCLPRSIKWNNNRFSTTNYNNIRMAGTLHPAGDGRPQLLDLIVSFAGKEVPWQIEFEYSKSGSVPNYIPSKISAFVLREGQKDWDTDVRIVSIEISEALLPKQAFMPDGYATKTYATVVETRSGKQWKTRFDDRLRPMGPQRSGILRQGAIIGGFVAISAIFAMWWRKRESTSSNKPDHGTSSKDKL